MTRHSFQPIDRILVKGYGLLSIAKNMGTNFGKNLRQNLSGKYSQKRLDHAKKSAPNGLKTSSKRVTSEATGDLIGNKIANRITKVSKNSQENYLETATNEYDKKIPKGRYVYQEKKQETIDELILE